MDTHKSHDRNKRIVTILAYLLVVMFASLAALILAEAPGTITEKAVTVGWATGCLLLAVAALTAGSTFGRRVQKGLNDLWSQLGSFKLM